MRRWPGRRSTRSRRAATLNAASISACRVFPLPTTRALWTGLDVDLCRAVAAAVFGDATKVKYTPTSVQQRWAVLTSGQVDLLSRNSTITFSRDANLGINFKGINFYEGQTFIVRKKSNVKTVKDMDGATICVAAGSTEERTVGDYFREHNMKLTIINFAKNDDAIAAYDTERCDAYTAGVGALAGQRRKLKQPGDHVILTQTISNDPQGPVVRQGDDHWGDIVHWVLNGTIAAEQLGVTSKNVDEMRAKLDQRRGAPPARRRRRFRADDRPHEGLDVQRHQAGRELRRVLRAHRRHAVRPQARARHEPAVDKGRHPVHAAVPVIVRGGRRLTRAARRGCSAPSDDGVSARPPRQRPQGARLCRAGARCSARSRRSCRFFVANAIDNLRRGGIASGFAFLETVSGVEVPFA